MSAAYPAALAELREAVRRCEEILDHGLRAGAPIEESIAAAAHLDDYTRRLRAAEHSHEGTHA